jgi:hypothetical protein
MVADAAHPQNRLSRLGIVSQIAEVSTPPSVRSRHKPLKMHQSLRFLDLA